MLSWSRCCLSEFLLSESLIRPTRPLTPWENSLRQLAGQEGYSEGFIEHYLLPLIYPAGLTREIQIGLGSIVIAVNLVVYGIVLYRLLRQ